MKFNNFFSAIVIVTCLFFVACNSGEKQTTSVQTSFFDKNGMDSTVKPGDNFFQFANGNWVKSAVIPDDQSGWGSFSTLYENNIKNLKDLLVTAAKSNGAKGSLEQKVGDYYLSGMDSSTIEKLGAAPLKPVLDQIDSIKDSKQLVNILIDFVSRGQGSMFGFYVANDEKNSAVNIPVFYQAGLSLPEKDYYTKKDSSTVAARNALIKYATQLFVYTGADSVKAGKDAQTILTLENEIAKSHRTPVELRDPQKNYNKISIAELNKMAPNLNWQDFFNKINVKVDSVNVSQPGYYKTLSELLVSQPVNVWKAKLKFDYINANTGLLSKDFTIASFQFNKIFSGQKVDQDRWKKMVNQIDGGLGELLGQLYVQKYFTDSAKKRMDELVNNLQKAFAARIKNLDWMSDSTKQEAIVKLNAFLKKIGYPGKWKNFDDVEIKKDDFFANAKSVQLHDLKYMVAKIGRPVDRTEWGMSPPTVNAYYNATNNEIVFPAGILQFPFFDVKADDAINYGGIGMAIGHEMTHGFDDQGSQYDKVGNMKNWWGKGDGEKFKLKTSTVATQYDSFPVFDSLRVNGQLTLGENLADLGGLAIAYDAFKLTAQGKSNEKIDGFTPDQRFFLSFAQIWRQKNRDESVRVGLRTDPHSPPMYRVNGPVYNFTPFYTAFGINESDKMYKKPDDRIRIW